MRLTQREIAAIKESVYAFDPNAKVYLFGARTRDDLRFLITHLRYFFLVEKVQTYCQKYA